MTDLLETTAGAVLGGVITLLRHPSRLRRVPGRHGDELVDLHRDDVPHRPGAAAGLTTTMAPAVAHRFIGHATVLLEGGGVRILTDPFLRGRLGPLSGTDRGRTRRVSRTSTRWSSPMPTPITSTSPRWGLCPADRRSSCRVVSAVAPVGPWSWRRPEVEQGDGSGWPAPPSRSSRRATGRPPGALRAQPVGYVVDIGRRVYFAGDTGRFPAMRDLAGALDVALLPVWTWGPHLGPGHLGPRSAAEALTDLRPAVAVPIHWGTLYPSRLDRVWRAPLLEPGERFAGHAGRLAPDVEVRVLRPGHSTDILPG